MKEEEKMDEEELILVLKIETGNVFTATAQRCKMADFRLVGVYKVNYSVRTVMF